MTIFNKYCITRVTTTCKIYGDELSYYNIHLNLQIRINDGRWLIVKVKKILTQVVHNRWFSIGGRLVPMKLVLQAI
jgi:hypothetical protein